MQRIVVLLVAGMLAGCAESSDPHEPGGETTGPAAPTPGAEQPEVASPEGLPASLPMRIDMDECRYLFGFVPIPWDAAMDLVGPTYRPFSWTFPGNEDLASMMVYGAECRTVVVANESIGPAASFWLLPSLERPADARSDSNNFLAYSLHSHEALVNAWSAWGPSELGSITLAEAAERATVMAVRGPNIEAAATVTEPGAISGLVSGFWDLHLDSAAPIEMSFQGAFGSMGGVLELAIPVAPFDVGGAHEVVGFGNGHGPLDALAFQPIAS